MTAKRCMPDELSIDQSDRYDELYGGDSLARAKAVAASKGGQLYTQVDAGDSVAYLRGNHLVNRTGWYSVLEPTRGRRVCGKA